MGLVALGGGGYGFYRSVVNGDRSLDGRLEPPPPPAGFSLKGGLRATAEQLDEPYRLKIDARFRSARDLAQLGREGVEQAAWELSHEPGHDFDATVPFPAPPTFERALSEVSGHVADHQMLKVSAIDPSTWLLAPDKALAVIIDQSQEGAAPRDPLAVARAAISLLFYGVDRLATSDELGGLALLWLSYAEQELQTDLVGEKSLLARIFGYSEASREFARQLPSGPFPAYLRFDDDALRAASFEPGVRPLWLRRQLALGDREAALTYRAIPLGRHLALDGLGRALSTSSSAALAAVAPDCELPVELAVAELAGASVGELRSRLEAPLMPQDIAALSEAVSRDLVEGPATALGLELKSLSYVGRIERWLDAALLRAGSRSSKQVTEGFVVALVTSCLEGKIEEYLSWTDERATGEPGAAQPGAAQPGAAQPGAAQAGAAQAGAAQQEGSDEAADRPPPDLEGGRRPVFTQLATWFRLRQRARMAEEKTGTLIAEAEDLTRLGPPAHYVLFVDLKERATVGGGESVPLARYLARHLDTRPAALRWAAEGLPAVLNDRRYEEYFYRSWSKLAASTSPEVARYWSDFSTRTAADVAAVSSSPEEYRLREALDTTQDDWRRRSALTEYLLHAHRYEEVPPVVDPWLRSYPTAVGAGLEWALSTLAKVELARGEVKKARSLLEPIRAGMTLKTLDAWVRVTMAQRDFALAREYLGRAMQAYPARPETLALGLRLAWAEGELDEAARLFAAWPQPHSEEAWRLLAAEFIDQFRTNTPAEAEQFLRKTIGQAPADRLVTSVADAFAAYDLFSHCSAVLEIAPSDPKLRLRQDVQSYVCRRKVDPASALSWIAGRVAPPERPGVWPLAFEVGATDLLWHLPGAPGPSHSTSQDRLWVMRAATALSSGQPIDRRVAEHFEAEARAEGYAAIGRYLCDRLDETTLISSATNDVETSRATHYLGLMAESQGRVADAIVWYRACVESNVRPSMEYRRSRERLLSISSSTLPLSALSQAHH